MTSRKERRQHNQKNDKVVNFNLKRIEPLTENQKRTFEAYHDGKNLMLHGIAGTGKSFISMYLALDEILKNDINAKLKISAMLDHLKQVIIVFYLDKNNEDKIIVDQNKLFKLIEQQNCRFEILHNKNNTRHFLVQVE